VAVCYAPEGPVVSTAEHAILLIFAVAKRQKDRLFQSPPGARVGGAATWPGRCGSNRQSRRQDRLSSGYACPWL
jgi:hypothetical protein